MHLVIHVTMFLAGAFLLTNFGTVDALQEVKTGNIEDTLLHPVATTKRLPLFNRRQLALRDRIRSRLLTTSAPVRIRSKIYPTRKTPTPDRVYVDSLKDQNNGQGALVRPKLIKPTEIPAFLSAKFPIMSRNPIKKYQFNRVRSTTPYSVILRHSDEQDDKFSMEDLVFKDNQPQGEKLEFTPESATVSAGVQSTTAIPPVVIFKFSDEQQDDDSSEKIINLPKGTSWESMKDSFVPVTEMDASIDNSPELPGEISTESEELYPLSQRTQTSPLEQISITPGSATAVSELQSTTTAIPLNANQRFSDELEDDDVSLEHVVVVPGARGISWGPLKEQMLIKPTSAAVEGEATEMTIQRTELTEDDRLRIIISGIDSTDDYTTLTTYY